jgi:hypothetical protein
VLPRFALLFGDPSPGIALSQKRVDHIGATARLRDLNAKRPVLELDDPVPGADIEVICHALECGHLCAPRPLGLGPEGGRRTSLRAGRLLELVGRRAVMVYGQP